MHPDIEAELPKADLQKTVEFESKRSGYFADEYRKSSLYWSSLCDVMSDNDGSTQQLLTYITGKLETDRAYSSAVYANADKVFGDKKGAAKLRHEKIRASETKAKAAGKESSMSEDAMVAGGGGRDAADLPKNSAVKAIWEMAEMDCRAARIRDTLCDEMEDENQLGSVKVMGKEIHRRFKELSDEGNACLVSLTNIDKRVGQAFLHLKETLGDQLGGKTIHDDVWLLDCAYRTAAVHQKEAWEAVTAKLKEVFMKMKDLEGERRRVLREFMMSTNVAICESWTKLSALCDPAIGAAKAIDPSRGAVDHEVAATASDGVEQKLSEKDRHELANTSNIVYADPVPSDSSFIDGLTAPLDSALVRYMTMIERREGKAIGSKYYAGLMVLSWDGFIHFFDMPSSSVVKQDASPSAAFQEVSPTISLDDLLSNKKDLDEVLMFKTTHTLQLDDHSTVTAVSSHKSHKIEVKGSTQASGLKRTFGSGHKTVTFRTPTEAEMNHALAEITDCIFVRGGMQDKDGKPSAAMMGRQSTGSRSSFGSNHSDTSSKTVRAAPTAARGPPQEPTPTPVPEEGAPASTVVEDPGKPAFAATEPAKEAPAAAAAPAEGQSASTSTSEAAAPDDSLGGDCSGARQAPSAAAGSFAWSSPAPPPSVGSPPAP
ncbi:unnamed protein product, partial [Scytosiphon promiscuus]